MIPLDDRREFWGDERKIERTLHPVHLEFVAIPSHFDIKSYLSIREITGQFMSQEITLESVELIAHSVKESPVFTLSSPTGTYAASAIMVIEIIKQVGLQVKNLSNFMPTDVKSYEHILKNTRLTNRDGKPVMDMTFVFINLYKLVEDGTLSPVIEALVQSEEYASEMNETARIYTSS